MAACLTPIQLVNLPIAEGATSPVPRVGLGAWIWSTSTNQRMIWNGTNWSATGA